MEKLNVCDLGLSAIDLNKINAVLLRYKEIESAVIYGSRAKGTFKPYSDIDLALMGPAIDLTTQHRIDNELDDLLLPYKIDLLVFHRIENKELIAHIHRVGRIIFEQVRTR